MPTQDRPDRSFSGTETMMWRIERDPWLAPSGGSLTLFDRPLDPEWFRRSISHAVVSVERLRQHVVAPPAPGGAPRWEVDPDFELDWHVRQIGAPGQGTFTDLVGWMAQFLQDPYDRTRPLWQYVLIDGVEGGRGALALKLHHTVADGAAAVALAGAYTTVERGEPPAAGADLAAVLAADAVAARPAAPLDPGALADQAAELVNRALRLPGDLGRRMAELLNPDRLGRRATEATDLARTGADQLRPAGSDLWRNRSRRRSLFALSLPYDDARRTAKALGGTINDLFLTGAAEAGRRYHLALGSDPERFHVTFVVSTRAGHAGAANAFTPVPVDVPAGDLPLAERFDQVRERLHERRGEVHGEGPMATVAGLANLLPTAVVTAIIRNQAAHIDFATSNLPGYLGDSYVAGAQTLHTYAWGPVAGTAFNITMVSTAGSLDIGVQVDPAAVTEPALLQRCLEESYRDLLAEPGAS